MIGNCFLTWLTRSPHQRPLHILSHDKIFAVLCPRLLPVVVRFMAGISVKGGTGCRSARARSEFERKRMPGEALTHFVIHNSRQNSSQEKLKETDGLGKH